MDEAKSFVLSPNGDLRDEVCELMGISWAVRIYPEVIVAGKER
jgi:hypothetical protein